MGIFSWCLSVFLVEFCISLMLSQFSYLNEQSPGEAQQDTVQADFEQ